MQKNRDNHHLWVLVNDDDVGTDLSHKYIESNNINSQISGLDWMLSVSHLKKEKVAGNPSHHQSQSQKPKDWQNSSLDPDPFRILGALI